MTPGTCSITLTEISPITGWLWSWYGGNTDAGVWCSRRAGLYLVRGTQEWQGNEVQAPVQAPTLTEHTGNRRLMSLGQTLGEWLFWGPLGHPYISAKACGHPVTPGFVWGGGGEQKSIQIQVKARLGFEGTWWGVLPPSRALPALVTLRADCERNLCSYPLAPRCTLISGCLKSTTVWSHVCIGF